MKKIDRKKQSFGAIKTTKRVVWTFEPDEDVLAILEEVLRGAPRGEKTRLVNAALREKHAEAAARIAEAEASAAVEKARILRNKAEGKHL